jgi:DNA-binding transcriptional ArsR family regulator
MSRITLSDPMIEEVSQLFLALGDPSRLKILRTLLEAKAPMSQGALVESTGLSQANASKHLSQLVRVGLVTREADGNTAYFQPVMPLVGNVCEMVCGHVTERVTAAYKALK